MGRRRTGTAWEKPKGSGAWLAAITLADGSRETEKVPPRKSGAPVDGAYAKAYAREWQRRYDEGEWVPTPKGAPSALAAPYTVASWSTAWAQALTIGTVADVRYIVAHYLAADPIGAVPLRALAPADLAAWVARLRATPSRLGGTLAPGSIVRYAQVLRQSLKAAVREGAIERDPFERAPAGLVPSAGDKTPGARRLWRYEPAEILALVTDPRVPVDRRLFYALAFLTGARASELAALRWSDWERTVQPLSRLNVARTAVYRRAGAGDGPWGRVEKQTKTGAVKEAPVHPALAAMLSAWWSSGWEAHQGRAPVEGDLIVPTKDGRSRVAITSWGLLKGDCERLGIRPRRLHGARHTMIRMHRDAGADREAVRGVTHAAPSRDAFDGYDRPGWARVCHELLKVPMALPALGESDSAPDSATDPSETPTNPRRIRPMPTFSAKRSPMRVAARNRWEGGRWGATRSTVSGDSAPDSATTGALSGEVRAYRYLELVELDGGDWRAG
jgi:integrase